MKIRYLFIIIIALVLTSACNIQASSNVESEVLITQETDDPENHTPIQAGTVEPEVLIIQETGDPENHTLPPNKITTPDCMGGEISSIGQSIAEDYEIVSYDQVMTWFCDGAEFEDILVALETEEQTGTPAVEMLQMLTDGFTWEEIWLLIGLTD